MNIDNKQPVIAGIFVGEQKPTNVITFFEQFIHEVVEVRDVGFVIKGRRIFLIVHCFIADAPARAFALNHFGHNSSRPCSKCKVEGSHYRRRMTYDGIRHELRTNEEYINLSDEDHHHGRSPLSEILDLVNRVPLEAMHSVWIGNVKKAISGNIKGKCNVARMSGRKLEILYFRMQQLQMYCPSEFNRKPNKMSAFSHFKATEFRQIALYTAPSLFKDVFEDNSY